MERASHPQWTDRVHSISSTVDCSRPQWTDRVQGPQDAKEQLPERRRGAARRCLLTPVVVHHFTANRFWMVGRGPGVSLLSFPPLGHPKLASVLCSGTPMIDFFRVWVGVPTAHFSTLVVHYFTANRSRMGPGSFIVCTNSVAPSLRRSARTSQR